MNLPFDGHKTLVSLVGLITLTLPFNIFANERARLLDDFKTGNNIVSAIRKTGKGRPSAVRLPMSSGRQINTNSRVSAGGTRLNNLMFKSTNVIHNDISMDGDSTLNIGSLSTGLSEKSDNHKHKSNNSKETFILSDVNAGKEQNFQPTGRNSEDNINDGEFDDEAIMLVADCAYGLGDRCDLDRLNKLGWVPLSPPTELPLSVETIIFRHSEFNKAVVSFRGTDTSIFQTTKSIMHIDLISMLDDDWIFNLLHLTPLSNRDYVEKYALWAQEEFGTGNVIFTGHSKGGGEALYASIATGETAVTFNPRPELSTDLLYETGQARGYRTEGDELGVYRWLINQIHDTDTGGNDVLEELTGTSKLLGFEHGMNSVKEGWYNPNPQNLDYWKPIKTFSQEVVKDTAEHFALDEIEQLSGISADVTGATLSYGLAWKDAYDTAYDTPEMDNLEIMTHFVLDATAETIFALAGALGANPAISIAGNAAYSAQREELHSKLMYNSFTDWTGQKLYDLGMYREGGIIEDKINYIQNQKKM